MILFYRFSKIDFRDSPHSHNVLSPSITLYWTYLYIIPSHLHIAENSLHKVAFSVEKSRSNACHLQFSSYPRSPHSSSFHRFISSTFFQTMVHSRMQILLHPVRWFIQAKVGENIHSLVHSLHSFDHSNTVSPDFILPCTSSSMLFAISITPMLYSPHMEHHVFYPP
jgi:hypothetical protein